MKYILIISNLLILTILSCNTDRDNNIESTRIVQKDTMINLMADLEIVESAIKLQQAKIQKDSLDKLSNMAFDSLYAFYKITPEQFKYNLAYYQRNMSNYQEMLDNMIIVLSRKKDSITVEQDQTSDTITKVE